MAVVRGERFRVRVVSRGEGNAVVVSARGRSCWEQEMDVPRPERTLCKRAHPGHPGKRRRRRPFVGVARPHGPRRTICRTGQRLVVEVSGIPQVESRVESGRAP